MKKKRKYYSLFTSINNCLLQATHIDFRIIIKLYLHTKLSLKQIIRIKAKHCSKGKITYKNRVIDLIDFLNEMELKYFNDILKNLLKNEYLFNTGMSDSRILYLHEFLWNIKREIREAKIYHEGNDNVKIDVIVVGAQRCATTWFYNICKKFNFIDVAIKEPSFFTTFRYCKGYNWYSSLYKSNDNINIDVSVNYLNFIGLTLPWIAEYEKQSNSKLKILYFVRKPSDRVISYINLKKIVGRGWNNSGKYIHSGYVYFYYVRNSDYLNRIKVLEKYFDINQIFIVFYEDIKKDPKSSFIQIQKFIDSKGKYKAHDLEDEIFKRKYHAGKKIIIYPLFKFLINIEKYFRLKFLKIEYSMMGKIILYILRIKGLLIITKFRQDRVFRGTTKELKELDKKYQNLKNLLKEWNIKHTDV